ncbi:MAG: double zinc ribbon domain-containing protein, partial [Methanobacteriaceae archaeon]
MIKCSSCSYDNPNDSNFCENCGFKLETKSNTDSKPAIVHTKIEDLCIICKSNTLTQEIKKENLGLSTGIYLVC